jgi:tetratricopeptide (TPR) repeat protein
LCVKIELSCCMFDYFLGNYASVRAQLRASLAVAETLNMQREIGYGCNLLGVIAGMEGEAAEAQRSLQKSIAIFRELEDEMGLADSLQELAQIQSHLNGNYAEAERLAGESLALSRRVGRLDWIAYALDSLAFAQFSRGEYGEAERNYANSLDLFRQIHHALGTALALGGLGLVAWARGGDALAQALDYVQESLAICREIGHPLHTSSRLYMLAQVNKDLGLYHQAEAYASEGLSIAQNLGSPVFMTYNLCALADVACTLGEFQLAREYLAAIFEHAHQIQPQLLLVALLHRASLFLAESVGKSAPVRLEMRMQAVELVLFVQRHPVALHIYTTRAARLQKELCLTLPPDRIASATSRAETHTLDGLIPLLVDDPMQSS